LQNLQKFRKKKKKMGFKKLGQNSSSSKRRRHLLEPAAVSAYLAWRLAFASGNKSHKSRILGARDWLAM
jgi:hypothetical protein